MTSRRGDDEDEGAVPLSHNPFGALSSLRDKLPEGDAPKHKGKKLPARAVVRIQPLPGEREVTVISELDVPPKTLTKWLEGLMAELACGGTIESGAIYLQGDQRDRLQDALTKRGVGRVIFD